MTKKTIAFLNIDNSTLYNEGNTCGIIYIPIIEGTFDNDYIHILHDFSYRYIYGYLTSKPIGSEGTIQNIMRKTIFLLLI